MYRDYKTTENKQSPLRIMFIGMDITVSNGSKEINIPIKDNNTRLHDLSKYIQVTRS